MTSSPFEELITLLVDQGFEQTSKYSFLYKLGALSWRIHFDKTPSVRYKGFVSVRHEEAAQFVLNVVTGALNERNRIVSNFGHIEWFENYQQSVDLFLAGDLEYHEIYYSKNTESQLAFQRDIILTTIMPLIKHVSSNIEYLGLLLKDEKPFTWIRDSSVLRTIAIFYLSKSLGIEFPDIGANNVKAVLIDANRNFTFSSWSEFIRVLNDAWENGNPPQNH